MPCLRGDKLVLAGARVIVVEKHGVKEMELPRKGERGKEEHEEDDRARCRSDLRHDEGAEAEQGGPDVDHEDGLPLVIARGDETVVDVAARIGIPKHTLYDWCRRRKRPAGRPQVPRRRGLIRAFDGSY